MKTILATDEPLIAELISIQLEMKGHSVETRSSGTQLLNSLEVSDYGLAIIDAELPDCHLRDILVEIRSRWCKNHLTILVISTDRSTRIVEQAFRFGADDFLACPLDAQEIQATLNDLFESSRKPLPCYSHA